MLSERYKDNIHGILSCYDRIVIKGTIPQLCYAKGMTSYLYSKGIRIFDYPRFAEPYRDDIRANAAKLASENDIEIEFIRKIETRETGRKNLSKVGESKEVNNRRYKGFNFFDESDVNLFKVLMRGEHCIQGFQNKTLRKHLPDKSSGQISRILKRLQTHGLIKKVCRCYKYYLTKFGKQVILTAFKIKEMFIIPELNVIHAQ